MRKKTHKLSDFPEGNYVEVISKLEKNRVRKLGIAVPDNFDELVAAMEDKKQKLRKEKQEKLVEQSKKKGTEAENGNKKRKVHKKYKQ